MNLDLLTPVEELTLAFDIIAGRCADDILSLPIIPDNVNLTVLRGTSKRGKAAFERYVNTNVRLVAYLAGRYSGRGMSESDLISEGMFGLMTAIKHFDPTRGFRFSTYAVDWICQAMGRALAQQSRLIRLPERKASDLMKIARAREVLTQTLDGEPDVTDIAAATGLSVETVATLSQYSVRPVSLDLPVGDDDESSTLGSLLANDAASDPADVVSNRMMGDTLRRFMKALPENEAAVLSLRFGVSLTSDEELPRATIEATGAALGLTAKQVRRLEALALKRLSESEDLRVFLS